MKYLFILLLLCSFGASAQHGLTFNQKIINCEDRWIAMSTEHGYAYGFVYLDNSAGLRLFFMGGFKVNEDNTFVPTGTHKNIVKILINAENIAVIPREKYSELQIEEVPLWLAFYRKPNNNIDRLFRLGYVYSEMKLTKEALVYLNAVRKIDNKYPGLDAEYYKAYRQLGNYGRAEAYAEDALDGVRKKPCEFNKRQILAFTAIGEMDKAEAAYFMALRSCTDETLKAELAYNIAFQYFKLKDKTKFNNWQNEVNRWVIPKDIYTDKMKMMAGKL